MLGRVPKWNDTYNVLVVEDDDFSSEIIVKILKMTDVSVYTASDGLQAFESVEKYTYDLVLMDIELPVMNGIEATKQIRKRGFEIPIIAMSGHSDTEMKNKFIESGMNDYLHKPVIANRLFEMMMQYLGEPEIMVSTTRDSSVLDFIVKISLINLTDAKQYFSTENPEKNFIYQLHKFRKYYANFTTEFREKFDAGKYGECDYKLHNLKNLSLMIGSKRISHLASRLKTKIRNGKFDKHTDRLVDDLLGMIINLWRQLDKYLPPIEEKNTQAVYTVVENLRKLIDESDYNTLNYFEENENILLKQFGQNKIEQLKTHISNFDFESSLDFIDGLM